MSVPLHPQSIIHALGSARLGSVDINVLSEVDSTNDWCRRELDAGRQAPLLCVSEMQRAGKGRRGRRWLVSKSGDIVFSYARRIDRPLHQLGCLSLAVGLAVRQTLLDAGVAGAQLKWPNDVLVDGRKLAGVLIDAISPMPGSVTVIIGVGINVQMPEQDEGIEFIATGMDQHITDVIDRNRVIAALLEHVEQRCVQLEVSPGNLVQELDEVFADTGEVDVLLESGQRVTGIMQGINQQGECRVQVDGEMMFFNSAEVSLRTGAVSRC